MQKRLTSYSLQISFVLIGTLGQLNAQQPPRAGIVEEDLRADPGDAYFFRGKNLYDEARRTADPKARQALYLSSIEIFNSYLNEFDRHPNAEPALWYLGSSYYQVGMVDDAKRFFATLLNRFGEGKYAAAAAYALAADHYNKREYEFAAPLFERYAANSTRPEDKLKGNLFAGNCYRLMDQDNEALISYKRIIDDPAGAPYLDQARLAIAHITFKKGKFADALKLFDQVTKSEAPPKSQGEAALHAALSAIKLGEPDLAETYLRLILDKPGMEDFQPEAQITLMEKYFSEKKFQAVLDIYIKSATKAKGEKEAARLMIVARTLLELKQAAKASDLFREVERLVPPENDMAFQASYYRLNCFFQIEGKFVIDQVDAFLQIYGKSRPKDTRIHTAMLIKAETLFSEKKASSAAEIYSKIDPKLLSESNRPGFYYQRGWCLAEASDPQGAIRSLTEFISQYPKDKRSYQALLKRANSYVEIGESKKAAADYDRVALDRAAPKDLITLAWLESARTSRKEGDIKDMLIRYKALLKKIDDLTDNLKAEANYWIGWGMVKTNEPKEAATYLDKARKLRKEAYARHSGLLLTLSYFAAQDPVNLAAEIELAIKGDYVGEIPKQALQWSGMQSYNAGNYASAAKFLNLTSNLKEPRTTPKEVWRYLGKALVETNKPEEALVAIKNLMEVEDSSAWKADALLDQARALFQLSRFDESRKSADAGLELHPQGRTSAGLRIVSASLHTEKGSLGEASADYLYIIQFHDDPDLKPLAIHKYTEVLEKQGKPAEVAKYKAQLKAEFPDWKAP